MNATNISNPAAQGGPHFVRTGATRPDFWSSPKIGTIVIVCLGLVMFTSLLMLNAAKPSGRPIIKIQCCDDPALYFSTSHALLFHHSFDLTSELRTVGVPTDSGIAATVKETGRPGIQFAIGYSLLAIPFLAAGTAVDFLTHHPADGFSSYALTFYYGSNIVFVIIGLLCLYRFLYEFAESLPISQRSRTWTSLFVTLALLPATTLGYYVLSPMSHASGFMSLSMFLLCWWRTKDSNSAWRWALLGMLGALAALCRWQNVLYLAAPLLCDLMSFYTNRELPGRVSIPRWLGLRALYCGAALVSFTPQMIEWKAVYDRYLTIPQGRDFIELPPHFISKVLFSTQHGWFIWTPVTLLCVIGLLIGCFRFRDDLLPWVVILCGEVAVNGSLPTDWFGGESFGIRSLTCSLPVAAVGLAVLLWLGPKKMQPVLWSLIAVCGVYSVLFAAQYRLDLLPKNDRLLASELIHDKFFLHQAYLRARSDREASGLIKKGDTDGAIQLLSSSIQRYGEDRTSLKTLMTAYAKAGDESAAQKTSDRLQNLLSKRLF